MSEDVWTIKRVLNWTAAWFREKGLDSPRLDAELLIADALGLDRVRLYLEHHKPLGAPELADIRARVERRGHHEPVAYITGRKGFWTLDLEVDPRVLIPRPETERLVELAVAALRLVKAPRVVDVGTGSGAIALAVASELPEAEVHAVDRSPDALAVARANAERLGLENLSFHEGDLLEPVEGPFDAVLSNPPYVASAEVERLMPDVARYEPHLALDGGPDGLDVIRRLVPEASRLLKPGGTLLIEIGADQGAAAASLLTEWFDPVDVHADYAGLDRVVEGVRR